MRHIILLIDFLDLFIDWILPLEIIIFTKVLSKTPWIFTFSVIIAMSFLYSLGIRVHFLCVQCIENPFHIILPPYVIPILLGVWICWEVFIGPYLDLQLHPYTFSEVQDNFSCVSPSRLYFELPGFLAFGFKYCCTWDEIQNFEDLPWEFVSVV